MVNNLNCIYVHLLFWQFLQFFFFFQLSNVNCSDSLLSKLNKSQDVLSPSHKTTQFGTLFERLNR